MAKKTSKKSAKKAVKKTAKKVVKKTAKKTAVKKAARKIPAKAKKAAPKKAAKKVSVRPEPPSTKLNPYLTFNGNCEEAFDFYRSVFGGTFSFMARFKDYPPQGRTPVSESEGEKIMHVALPISKETIIMGSDTSVAHGHVSAGTNFSLSVSTFSEAEADRIYDGLSEEGTATMPMSKTFWGSYYGMLKDKFEIQWMVSFDQPRKE